MGMQAPHPSLRRAALDASISAALGALAPNARVEDLAAAFLGLGLRQGQRVGLRLIQGEDRLACLAALWQIGAVVVPLDPALPAARLTLALQGSGAEVVIYSDALAPLAFGGLRQLRLCDLDARAEGPDLAHRQAQVLPQHPAAILYGEGAQDSARGVVLSQEAILTAARGLIRRFDMGPDTRLGLGVGFNHAVALSGALAVVIGGGALGTLDQPLTHLILAEGGKVPADTPPPQVLITSADGPAMRALARRFPDTKVYNSYQRAEVAGIAIASDPRDPPHTAQTTFGRPLSGIEVMIVDPRTGMDMLLYEVGEIWLRGPAVLLRYHDDPQASRKVRDASGFFKTGDMGYLDSEGRVILCRDAYAQI